LISAPPCQIIFPPSPASEEKGVHEKGSIDIIPVSRNDILDMEDIPVTRSYLESITTNELIRLADNWGVDIPPDLDRIFIIEELLENAREERDEYSGEAEPALAEPGLIESVPLPRQYNITFISVMIRDPLWAFIFWEVKSSDKELFERDADFDGYYLKVSPQGKCGKAAGDGAFTVPVKPSDTAWYLGFSPGGEGPLPENGNTCQYQVELCAARGGEETVLAVSNSFRLPVLPEFPGGAEKRKPWENPLVRLSGYEDFHILRKSERLSRAKKHGSASAGC
jgi:hypothetical protein